MPANMGKAMFFGGSGPMGRVPARIPAKVPADPLSRLFPLPLCLTFPPFAAEPSNPCQMREYHALLRSTSRTFAAGIEALPGELRDAVTLAYLVLRVSDYFEDSPNLPASDKRKSLERWAALIERAGEPLDEGAVQLLLDGIASEDRDLPDRLAAQEAGPILAGLARISLPFRAPIQRHTTATTLGMSRWSARGSDFPDEAALDDYMFEVAGRVGLLLTELFSAHSPRIRSRAEELTRYAVSFGLGLQTVNVIRGLHEDPERGWSYVPKDILSPDIGPAVLRDLEPATQRKILDFLVRKAGRHIADGLQYCQILPRRERGIRVFCIIPALLALKTAQLSSGDLRVFTGPVKLARREVRRTVVLTELCWFSDAWLRTERRRALRLAGTGGDS
jgi:farnesyl-diphosphate farnesyltransferase